MGGGTEVSELPEAILQSVFAAVEDTRTRNAMALVCQRWRETERATRTSLALRGIVRDVFLVPTCFGAVTTLDLSRLSPYGSALLPAEPAEERRLVARRLRQAFPRVTSLTVYARGAAVAAEWPGLRRVKLVRWHRRPEAEVGAELGGMLRRLAALAELDLSSFYCWTEDVAAAVGAAWPGGAALARLDLLGLASGQGFGSGELLAISAACPNLERLRAGCLFNPRLAGHVGEDALRGLAGGCPRLAVLHLLDPRGMGGEEEGGREEERGGGISGGALEEVFGRLPRLEDLAMEMHAPLGEAGAALEALGRGCKGMRALRLGRFQGVCRAAGLHLDGVAVCGGLTALCLKDAADLADPALAAIARGCSRLEEIELRACPRVTAAGVRQLAEARRGTLRRVSLSRCEGLTAARAVRALEPVRDRIEFLHVDCVREGAEEGGGGKRRRVSRGEGEWGRLRGLSAWVAAGETLGPLAEAGLDRCPRLEEVSIKVEGDCRRCVRPSPRSRLGLDALARYPRLRKMKLDCGDAHGYALTAPMGHMDLSLWERFYLSGIGELGELEELDYWPPQDRDMNQRSLTLPAAGQLAQCCALRKLFIHGTAYEHFMRFLLRIPTLRDVQLVEDYYPAPEGDATTETRFDSCSRFEAALNRRPIPD
ncbi:RNI-like superfamily protein [Wolffia australiana]